MADDDSRAGARYATKAVSAWTDEVHAAHDPILLRAFDAPKQHDMPAIQLGVSEARAMELFLRMIGARKVVEIGALAGFSAVRILRALPQDGHLWTIEHEPRHAQVVRQSLDAAEFSGRFTVCEGAARELLPDLVAQGLFDAVFIDADKENYHHYGRWARDNLRPGGLLIGDNAYFFGKLLEPDSAGALAMRSFHEEAAQHFESVCLPTPDGMLLGLRRPH